ncbi:MAG: FAD:protein FMN transferase [Deltaproteobacteria bacterium]|nr:FAD:protein FMN transferase [Deltaproteobacteria bacterium]
MTQYLLPATLLAATILATPQDPSAEFQTHKSEFQKEQPQKNQTSKVPPAETQDLGGPATVERHLTVMGTELHLSFEGRDRAMALAASETALRELEATEDRLSTWRPNSELSRLNAAAPGFPFRLSPTLRKELTQAHRCWKQTRGSFDPTIGALLDAWGVRTGGREPSEAEQRKARQSSGMWAFHLSLSGSASRQLPGLRLDESAFGKGAGLDRMAEKLRDLHEEVTGFIDLGGQWLAVGPETPRTVSIAHPHRRQLPVVDLQLTSGSVATSGNSERGLAFGSLEGEGPRTSHILDPATGNPVPDFGSVTVVTASALEADCLSTGLYVMGPQRALGWAKGHPGVEVLVLEFRDEKLTARATSGLKGRLTVLVADLPLTFLP